MPQHLRDKLCHVSSSPGVYLMKDQQGRVIYVGKARHLKNPSLNLFFQVNAAGCQNRCAD